MRRLLPIACIVALAGGDRCCTEPRVPPRSRGGLAAG